MSEKIIIDTDIGTDVDDAVALVLALKSPELDIQGVTTVYGDTDLRAAIALKLIELSGKTGIPVAAGCARPLVRREPPYRTGYEGKGLDLGENRLRPIVQHAADLIIEKVSEFPGEITLVTIGPLTNAALAFTKDPGITDKLKGLIVMAGATRLGKEGLSLPVAEYNVKCDPEAAFIVFSSGIPLTMVGLDVTTKVRLNRDHLGLLKKRNTPLTDALAALLDVYWSRGEHTRDGSCMHDPLALALAVDPSLVDITPMNIVVETAGAFPGQTVAVEPEEGRAAVRVCTRVDADRVLEFLKERLLQ